jgi:hypothetical protein
MIKIKCSLCGERYNIYHQEGNNVDVDPHNCPFIEESSVAFVDRVCSLCKEQIRCRRDGFECNEAVEWTVH